ncbi:hypothetical protein [Brevibacillus choshinensis]|uniref:hypothetical protein n=1 Tax=Brevibacillus choshinensis TaxID=54911 RepID=UPI002E22EA89|nr:hypothetical protein [Brevibacillus choshinensis]
MNKIDLWEEFCLRFNIFNCAVPLFETEGSKVTVFDYGLNNRKVLKRSEHMKDTIIDEVEKLINDYNDGTNQYEGLIYMMFWKVDQNVIPLYIGKAEKYGKKGQNFSSNLNIQNENFFARWGYNYAYHLGDLSAVVCLGHPTDKANNKYEKWAKALFCSHPTEQPQLKQQVFFWTTCWRKGEVGVWKEFGSTSLTFLEYLLIGLASDVFPNTLLNAEGVNRKQ